MNSRVGASVQSPDRSNQVKLIDSRRLVDVLAAWSLPRRQGYGSHLRRGIGIYV